MLAACGGGEEGRTPTGVSPNGFRDRGRRQLSAGSSMNDISICTPSRNRTCDLLVRSQALSPLSYGGIVPPAGVEPAAFALSERRPYHAGHDGQEGGDERAEEAGFEPAPAVPVCLSRAAPSATRPPLHGACMRTRRGIRTPNLSTLNRAPLPVGLPGREWSDAGSNRAREACKATLCTSTHPMAEPAVGLEPTASRLQGGCAYPRRLAGTVPSARFERALYGPSDRRLCRWATRAGNERCERRIRTSTNGFRARHAAWLHQLASLTGSGYGESNPGICLGKAVLCR